MSKLSETLSNLGQALPARLGFGQPRERKRNPVILLVGLVDTTGKTSPNVAMFDIALTRAKKGGRPATTAPSGGEKWGTALSDCTKGDLEALKESRGDFVLIESETAPATALRDEDLGKGFVVPLQLTDERAHAIEDLPFDFLLLRGAAPQWPLTVGQVISLQEKVSLFSKHIFLELDVLPPVDDLSTLRDMPISGLVIEASRHTEKEISDLKEALAALEPRKPRSEHLAVLPGGQSNGTSGHSHEPDEPDDDEFDDQ